MREHKLRRSGHTTGEALTLLGNALQDHGHKHYHTFGSAKDCSTAKEIIRKTSAALLLVDISLSNAKYPYHELSVTNNKKDILVDIGDKSYQLSEV